MGLLLIISLAILYIVACRKSWVEIRKARQLQGKDWRIKHVTRPETPVGKGDTPKQDFQRGWIRIKARCVDKEIRCVHGYEVTNVPFSGGYTWVVRLLCEFEWNVTTYRVTPRIWRGCFFKSGLRSYMKRVIQPDETCILDINPNNPFDAKLSSGSIATCLLKKR